MSTSIKTLTRNCRVTLYKSSAPVIKASQYLELFSESIENLQREVSKLSGMIAEMTPVWESMQQRLSKNLTNRDKLIADIMRTAQPDSSKKCQLQSLNREIQRMQVKIKKENPEQALAAATKTYEQQRRVLVDKRCSLEALVEQLKTHTRRGVSTEMDFTAPPTA